MQRREIRDLTTASELELVQASAAGSIRKLSKQALQSNIARARRLRDKQRDLYRRQRLRRQARTGTRHGGNERTARKAELFDETLRRFREKLQAMQAKPASRSATRRPATAGGKGPPARPRAARKTSGQAAMLQKARTPRMKAMQAHVSSRGRRSQARRDSR